MFKVHFKKISNFAIASVNEVITFDLISVCLDDFGHTSSAAEWFKYVAVEFLFTENVVGAAWVSSIKVVKLT